MSTELSVRCYLKYKGRFQKKGLLTCMTTLCVERVQRIINIYYIHFLIACLIKYR